MTDVRRQAAGTYGATVEALTISDEQKIAIDRNVADAGLSHVINVHVMDYRQMPEHFHHAFDAVVSIGVMEHGMFHSHMRYKWLGLALILG